jgi:hypothetical protein
MVDKSATYKSIAIVHHMLTVNVGMTKDDEAHDGEVIT